MGWGMGSGDRYVWCTVHPNNPGIWKEAYNCVEDMCVISVKAQICYDWVTFNRETRSRTLGHFFSSQYSLHLYLTTHNTMCSFHWPRSLFCSLLSFPHCYRAHRLSSPPHNGFCDVQRRIFWSVLIAFNGREQGEGRKKGLETCRAQSIILIKRASVMLGCMRHTRARA